jgi:type IV pilus assembly protein PilE
MTRANRSNHSQSAGFTLLELLIVVAVFSIIMSMSVAGYRQYITRANRVDATTLLLRVAAAQERYYLEQNTYTADLAELGFPDELSERGYYKLAVAPALGGLVIGYTATATVVDDESQSADEKCQDLTINESGLRSSAPEDAEVCWG